MGHQGFCLGGLCLVAHCRSLLLSVLLALVVVLFGAGTTMAYTASTVGDFGNVTVMEVEGNYDANLPDGIVNADPRRVIAKEFFRSHRDDYDFLVIFTNFDFAMPEEEVLAFFSPVRNDVQGIGQAIYDHSDLYGSHGRLQGTIDMGNLANCGTNPQDVAPYDATLDTLSHEILHRWSAFISFEDEFGNVSDALIGKDGSHWSYLLDSDASLELGNDWRDNGDGTFTSVAIRRNFSPLDLYLMGMVGKEEVTPLLLIDNPDVDPAKLPKVGDTISGTARTVTIDNIVAAMGNRNPSVDESQKSFTAAFIYATVPGTFLKDELYGIENLRNGFLTRFSILTNGAALVKVTSKSLEELPKNPGIQPPSTLPRTATPRVEDGVAWLIGQQHEDGSWLLNNQTIERDTAESVSALEAFIEGQGKVQLGLAWLAANPAANTDYLARRIEASALNGRDVTGLVAELIDRQNADGGWGLGRGFVSNPADTGLALRALADAGSIGNAVIATAIDYLRRAQNADGGWSAIGGRSLIQPTSHALLALNHYRGSHDLEQLMVRGADWLASKQNSDGGFGNSPSTVYDSAVAVQALTTMEMERPAVSGGVGYLLQRQGEDGSWNGSPYQTAAAVKAIWGGTLDPDLLVKASEISFIPEQISQLPTNAAISVTIWNNGRTDVAEVAVELYRDEVKPANLVERQIVAVPGMTPVVLTFADQLTTAGEHPYQVIVDRMNIVTEADEGNNQASAVLFPLSNHDFVIIPSETVVSTDQTVLGETVAVDFTVHNRGTEAVSGLEVVLQIAGATPRTLETLTVDIPAGKSVKGRLNWLVDQLGDSLPLQVSADPNNRFRETDETNNQVVRPVSVLVAPPQQDLRILPASISFSPNPVTVLPTLVETRVLVENLGQTPVSQTLITLSTGGVEVGRQVVNLPGQSSVEVIFPVSVTGGNSQSYTVKADADNAIAEWRENNNQASATLPVAALHDFYVDGASLTTTPQPGAVNSPLTISSQIGNRGTASAYNVQVRYTLKSEGRVIDIATHTLDLPAGATVNREIEWVPSVAGQDLVLSVEVDPFGQYAELDEVNNLATLNISVEGWSIPNLTLAWQDLTVTPSPAEERGDAMLRARVVNNGFAMVEDVRVDFYLGLPDYGGERLGSSVLPQIAAGGVALAELLWPGIPVAGERLIYAVVDPDNLVTEIDETDNDNFIELKILNLPDLVVAPGSVAVDPAMPSAGRLAEIAVTVSNAGEQSAGPVVVRLLDDQELLAETALEMVAGLSQQIATLQIDTIGREGENHLVAVVDPGGLIAEQQEDNNATEFAFAVQDADLYVSNKYFSPNGDGAKDDTTLYFRLDAPDNLAIGILNQEGVEVRRLNNLEWAATDHGQAVWDGLDDAGRVVDDGIYRMEIIGSGGSTTGAALVIVDTNRSPITEAIGTPFLHNARLGELPNWFVEPLSDESGYLFLAGQYDVSNEIPSPGLYLWRPQNNAIELLTPPEWFFSPFERAGLSYVVSPDGTSVALILAGYSATYGLDLQSQLWLLDLQTRELRKVDESKAPYQSSWYGTISYGNINTPVFSPDGKSLVYTCVNARTSSTIFYETRSTNVDSINVTTLYPDRVEGLRWSPQSDKLAFSASGQLWLASRAAGFTLEPPGAVPAATGPPVAWSPDGNRLVFGDHPQVFVLDQDNQVHLLFNSPGYYGEFFSWLDNTQVLYVDYYSSSAGYKEQYWVLDGLGGNPARALSIETESDPFSLYHLSPDKRTLLVLNKEIVRLYRIASGQVLCEFATPFTVFPWGDERPNVDPLWDLDHGLLYLYGPSSHQFYDYEGLYFFNDYLATIDLETGSNTSRQVDDAAYNYYDENGRRALFEGALFSSYMIVVPHPDGDPTYIGQQIRAFDPSEEDQVSLVQIFDSTSPFRGSSFGGVLNYTAQDYAQNTSEALYQLRSLLNLVADLRAVTTRTGISIKGSAADRYLEGYRLEYAEISALDNWTLLQTGDSRSVIDQELLTWLPPAEGTYLLRLTSWDRAGNRKVDETRVAWGDALSIANLVKDESIISPNMDGIKDEVTLSYRVLFPVHLEFRILDEQDRVVRIIFHDHLQIGQQALVWDGRDDAGAVVPDGRYRITVFDYQFPLLVDQTPPVSSVAFSPISINLKNNSVGTNLIAHASDPNLRHWVLERGSGSQPTEWNEIDLGETSFDQAKPIDSFGKTELQALVGYQYRLTAEDFAGNRSSALSGFVPGQLMLFNNDQGGMSFDGQSLRPAGEHQLRVVSTFFPEIVGLQVECRIKSTWSPSTAQLSRSEQGWEVLWDNRSCGPYGNAVRVKATTPDQQSIITNEIRYRDVFEALLVSDRCIPLSIAAENWVYEELVYFKAQYQDAGKWVDYYELSEAPTGVFSVPLPELVEAKPNLAFRLLGRGAETGTLVQTDALQLSTDCSPPPVQAEETISSVETPCNVVNSRKEFTFNLDIPSEPQKFSVLLFDSGAGEVLAEVAGQSHLAVDLARLTEGVHSLKLMLTYRDLRDGAIRTAEKVISDYLVDTTLPSAEISYPIGTIGYCPGIPDALYGGSPSIPVEGVAADAYGVASYTVRYRTEQGDAPWQPTFVTGTRETLGGLGTWRPDQLGAGGYELHLEVVDQAGNRSCVNSRFSISSPVAISRFEKNFPVFSPNGDGFKDALEFSYEIASAAFVDLTVLRDGSPVRHLQEGLYHLGGSATIAWDGRDDNGQVVPDGSYTVNLVSSDGCQYPDARSLLVEVHNEAPSLAFTSPDLSKPLGMVVEVSGSVSDPYLAGYQLEVGSGDLPEMWTILVSGIKPIENEKLSLWNTFGLEGVWTFRLTARDTQQNRSEQLLHVNLGERGALIKSLDAAPRLFSPNGDGNLDVATIKFELTTDCLVDLEILSASGEGVFRRHFVDVLSPGLHQEVWGAIDEVTGRELPSAAYKVVLTATLPEQPEVSQSEFFTIVADHTPPELDLSQPAEGACLSDKNISLVGTVKDAHLENYTIYLDDGAESKMLTEGNRNHLDMPFWTLVEPAEGAYAIRIEAADEIGNRSELVGNFSVDRTPPQLNLLTPVANELFGQRRAEVVISAEVVESNPDICRLRYRKVGAPEDWALLMEGEVPPGGLIGTTWNVGADSGLVDGDYDLSLWCRDLAGLEAESRLELSIDNSPPAVGFSDLGDGEYLHAGDSLSGSIQDANLDHASLLLAPGTCRENLQWSPLRQFSRTVDQALLHVWELLPADGEYCLQLFASDKLSAESRTSVNVSIDTEPPSVPEMTGEVTDRTSARLNWEPVTAPDLAGYRLYRDEAPLATALPSATGYLDENLDEGSYLYRIRAFDEAGNESEPSKPVQLDIDLSSPTVALSAPVNTGLVQGLVDIQGTAFSREDFREYRVFVGAGADPDTWTLLRRSPVPVSGGVLAEWDTYRLAEDQYTIRLEAEDLTGNISTRQVVVSVDNTPPAAPVLVSAEASGAAVALFWEPSADSDIAGYLLFRNGELANATGPVVGEWVGYLVPGTEFIDPGLVDGTHSYFILAMDRAGNLSTQSNLKDVEIDLRTPSATIIAPADGHQFEQPVTIVAASEDLDVASVQLQYRTLGADAWLDLGGLLENGPFAVVLDSEQLGLDFGIYQLRAVATDRGGLVDPDPAVTTIEYRDLTPPAIPAGIKASVVCDEISVTWEDSSETDLAGYNLYLIENNGPWQVNSSLLTNPSWSDNGFDEGIYAFALTAVDQNGNESPVSATSILELKYPLWSTSGIVTIAEQMDLSGRNAFPNMQVRLQVNGIQVAETLADSYGNFTFDGVPLANGENELGLIAEDSNGNLLCGRGPVWMTRTNLMPAPEGLHGEALGYNAQLGWLPVENPELDHYNVYRDGELLNGPQPLSYGDGVVSVGVSSSYLYTPPVSATDGNVYSYWRTNSRYWTYYASPEWLLLSFDRPRLVEGFEITWASDYLLGTDYDLQVADGSGWRTVASVRNNFETVNSLSLETPWLTGAVRLSVLTIPSYYGAAGVAEFTPIEKVATAQPSYAETLPQDGVFHFQVASVNLYGMEGPLTAPVPVGVGDTEPSSPPVLIDVAAPSEGASLQISWQPGSADSASYTIYRSHISGGPYEPVGHSGRDERVYLDHQLVNGERYFYVVTSADEFGNESTFSVEGSGVPADSLAPHPPGFFAPARAGAVSVIAQPLTSLAGFAEPGSQVSISRNGLSVGEVSARQEPEVTSSEIDSNWYDIRLSPDQIYLAYADDDNYYEGLLLLDRSSGESTLIIEEVSTFSWSPDGSRLLYRYYGTDGPGIAYYDLATGQSHPVAGQPWAWVTDPSWAPDGEQILFIADRDGSDDIWLADLGDGSLIKLVSASYAYSPRFSPDGRYVAYIDDGYVYLFEVASGQVITVYEQGDIWYLAWAPGSDKLALVDYDGDRDLIIEYDLVTQQFRHRTDSQTEKGHVVWAPDGETLAFKEYAAQSWDISLWVLGQDWSYPAATTSGWIGKPQWNDSGQLIFEFQDADDNATLNVLVPAGRFESEEVELQPGENRFSSTATDPSGNQSQAAGEMTVIYDTRLLPDIEVSSTDISLYPAAPAPGERVIGHVRLRNPTTADAAAFSIDYYLLDTDGQRQFLESRQVAGLTAGQDLLQNLTFTAPSSSGLASLLAVVDPADELPELRESNNAAIREFRVSATAGIALAATLSAGQISSQEDLAVDLELLNRGDALTGLIKVQIEDVAGQLVTVLDQVSRHLPYGADRTSYTWNSGISFAGDYQVRIQVSDAQGGILAEQLLPFAVMPDQLFDLSLTTDRANYGPQQPVAIVMDFANLGTNSVLDRVQLRTRILSPAENEVFESARSVDVLYPGASNRLTETWGTALMPPGDYRVVVEADENGETIALASSAFSINAISQLRGRLEIEPDVLVYGLAASLSFSAENLGNLPADGTLQLTVLDPVSLETVAVESQAVSIPVAGKLDGYFPLSTGELGLQGYRCQLKFQAATSGQLLTETTFKVVDGKPPVISAEEPCASETYRTDVKLAAHVTDDISGVETVSYRLDDGPWQVMPFVDLARGSYAVVWRPRLIDNGAHVVEFQAADRAGNSHQTKPLAFEVHMDVNPPETTVSYGSPSFVDGNGMLFLGDGSQLTLLATDDISGVVSTECRLDDAPWSHYSVPVLLSGLADGAHRLAFRSEDAFGNQETEKFLDFMIDNTPPEIALTNLLDGGFYNSALLPAYVISDQLPVDSEMRLSLNGVPLAEGQPATDEGQYLLTINAADRLGHQATLSASFGIDLTAPVSEVSYADPALMTPETLYVSTSTLLTLSAVDVGEDASGVSRIDYLFDTGNWMQINAPLDLAGLTEGAHQLSYQAVDLAGNVEVAREIQLTVDNLPPVTTANLVGTQHQSAEMMVISGTTLVSLSAFDTYSGVELTEYRIDGGAWQEYVPFVLNTAGERRIDYRSRDRLGHLEPMQTLVVYVDQEPPVTTLNALLPNLEEGDGLYITRETILELTASDDLAGIARTEYRLDGGEWQLYAPFTLVGRAEGYHSIGFRSMDTLGNLETEQTLSAILDNTSPQVTVVAGEPSYFSADGTLYVGPQTPIAVVAEDTLVGVDYAEFRLDNGPWSNGAFFFVTAEGSHLVEAWAGDRLGHQTDIQTLELVTDVAPPVTRVAFEPGSFFDGDRLLVSAGSLLTLSAEDSLSGVNGIIYRFDEQNEWITYQLPVSLMELAPGDHELQIQAVDQVGNRETIQSFTLTRMELDFHAAQLTLPRVLFWLPPEEPCNDSKSDQEEHGRDGEHHQMPEEGEDVAERLVEAIFSGLDAYYTVVRDEESFVSELRSGAYNVLALFNSEEPANAGVLAEVRAAVRRGTGLVAANWKQELHPLLRDVFGVVPRGRQQLDDKGETTFLYPEPFGELSAPTLSGTIQRVDLVGGQLAGMIPAPEQCEGVQSVTLHLQETLDVGDRVTVRLGRLTGKHLHLLEQESWHLSELKAGPVDLENGDADANLILVELSEAGVEVELTSAEVGLGKDYALEVTIERPGGDYDSGIVEFATDCFANPQPGITIGPFRLVDVDFKSEKQKDDLPVLVFNQFGSGAGVLMTYDPLTTAANNGIEEQAELFEAILEWTVPASETARAAGVLLLNNHLNLSGMTGGMNAVETPGPGISSPEFFDLPVAPFSLDLDAAADTEVDYRYLVRFADTSGIYTKQTNLYYQAEMGPVLAQSHVLNFDIAESSTDLLERTRTWIDQQLGVRPDNDDGYGEQREERAAPNVGDEPEVEAGWMGMKQRLLHIGCLPQNSRHDLEQVIMQTLALMDQLERLTGVEEAVLIDLSEFLRVVESKWYQLPEWNKCSEFEDGLDD